jgi:hypothetical protein
MRRIILLTWYFFALTSSGGVLTVGPFADNVHCETVRRLVASTATPVRGHRARLVGSPICWSPGRRTRAATLIELL